MCLTGTNSRKLNMNWLNEKAKASEVRTLRLSYLNPVVETAINSNGELLRRAQIRLKPV